MTEQGAGPVAVDLRALDGLRDQVGDDVVRTVLVAYVDALPRRVDAIRAAIVIGGSVLRDAAHALTASSRAIGAQRLGDLCARVESDVVAGDAAGAAEGATLAVIESDRVRTELETHLAPGSAT